MIFAVLAILLAVSGPVWADSGMLLGGVANRQMPLDNLTTASGAWSLRRLRTGYTANKAVTIRRASDSTTADIGFTASGDFDTATAATFCNATTCFVRTWYDQSGGTRDLAQATAAQQPAFIFNCLGVRPCLRLTTSPQNVISAASFTPATGVASLSAVGRYVSGAGTCTFMRENGSNNFIFGQSANWILRGAAANDVSIAGTGTSWHSAFGVNNGASSVLRIDGSETTGTATGNTTTGTIAYTANTTGITCELVESMFWDNLVTAQPTRILVTNSQRIFWGL